MGTNPFRKIEQSFGERFAKWKPKKTTGSVRSVRKWKNVFRSVGMKLFLIFFVSIVAFVVVVGMTSYSISKSVIEKKVSAVSSQVVILAQQKLDNFFDLYEKVAIQIMSASIIEDVRQMSQLDMNSFEYLQLSQKISDGILPATISNSKIKNFSIFTNDGIRLRLLGDSGYAIDANPSWFKFVQDQKGKPVWMQGGGDNAFDASPGKIALARQVVDPTSYTPVGVIVMELNTTELGSELEVVKLGDGDQIMVIDDRNTLVFGRGIEEFGGQSPIALTAEQIQSDSGKLQANGNLIAYSKSIRSGWYLIGSVPIASLVSEAGQILDLTTIVSLVAAVIAIIIGLLIVRMIGTRLNKMMQLMRQGANGNLQVRSDFKSSDEIGRLGRSFDQMMEQITQLVQQTNQSAQEVLETALTLSGTSKTTAISAREIAVATEQISGGAGGLSIESEKGAELTMQIGDKVRNVIDSNSRMELSASGVRQSSEQGIQFMRELSAKTQTAEEMIRAMADKVDHLKQSTRSIRQILDMLGKIAKQTNILSLNAAIEAARAGASGKGFKVVADEVNRMADQSRQSIEVVGEITEKIQSGIDETVHAIASAYPIFQEQIGAVREADSIFAQVQANMGEFIGQLGEVSASVRELNDAQLVLNTAMHNVSAVAEQSLATSQEVASLSSEQLSVSDHLVQLSEKLEQLSGSLKQSLTRFKI